MGSPGVEKGKKKKVQEINVVVTYTEGFERRFTEACLRVLESRMKKGIPLDCSATEREIEPQRKVV